MSNSAAATAASPRLRPVLKYPGAKWNIAPWIVSHFPEHRMYLEPFFGSGTVFFAKPRAKFETINDLDGRVVNLFRVLRDRPDDLIRAVSLSPFAREEYQTSYGEPEPFDPLESARRFVVRTWQAHGSRTDGSSGWRNSGKGRIKSPIAATWTQVPERLHAVVARLQGIQIECRPALDVLRDAHNPDLLVYADPPYPLATRAGRFYRHEMTDNDHDALLDALNAHPGPVVLSGYPCQLYEDRLSKWEKVSKPARAEIGRSRTEILWIKR